MKRISNARGFSLTEMVVALFLTFLIGMIAVPVVAELLQSYHLGNSANEISFEIQRARMQAMSQSVYVCVYIEPEGDDARYVYRRFSGDVGGADCSPGDPEHLDEEGKLSRSISASSGSIEFDATGMAVSNDAIKLTNDAGTKVISTSILGKVTIS